MVEWSRAFGNVPVYLHHADREWVLRSDPAVIFWEGDSLPLNEEFTLVHCGGHFDGGTVLHWAGRAGRPGRLLTGDVIAVLGDHENVTFMHKFGRKIRPAGCHLSRPCAGRLAADREGG
jgi:glyoxylase-like metal-dependent hydrolase (beta-lactamase superfamily II)